jgi:hypothetical protein
MTELSSFLAEHPVIVNADEAKNGGAYLERSRIALAEIETERKGITAPINERLTAINGAYKIVREPLEKALAVLRGRLTAYANEVERQRIAEVERLRLEREAAEATAREAERLEQDAIARADVGEVGVDVVAPIEQADAAFADFRKADRRVAVAEKGVPVRIGSMMGGKALSMKTRRVLVVDDAAKAVVAMWPTDKLRTAILQCAKEFEDAYGELPEGVRETFERSM